jgi:hypothetical protein
MATIVRAHGGWDGNNWTFVPDGVTIKFYSNEDEYLFTANAVAALSQSNFDNANESYGPGNTDNDNPVWVQNYELGPRTNSEMQRDLSAFAEAATIKFVGSELKAPIKLCEGDSTTCTNGIHKCEGVFGQVKDTEIIYMACRGIDTDADAVGTRELGGSTENMDWVNEWATFVRENKGTDPDGVESQLNGLPQDQLATLMVSGEVKNFMYVREALRTYESDPDTFLRQVAGLVRDGSDPELLNAYRADPTLGPLISQAVARPGSQDMLEDQGYAWNPRDTDYERIAELNQQNVKATADEESVSFVAGNGMVLIGEGHDFGYVRYAGSADDVAQGSITVSKAGVFSAGTLEVTGAGAHQDAVREMLESFSNKDVEFV